MKIINVDIDDRIILKNIEDTDTGTIKSINSDLKLPYGNYQNILLNFNFINPIPNNELNLFTNFKIDNRKQIDVEITSIEINKTIYKYASYIPAEVFEKRCKVLIGVYGFSLDDNENLELRLSLVPILSITITGSYEPEKNENIIPGPTIFEKYFNKIKNIESQIENSKNDYDTFVSLYNSKPYYFNNIDSLKIADLKAGDMAITLGYYELNDGGGGEYSIRLKTDNDVEDNASIHFLNNGLVAELIISDLINIRQLGATPSNDIAPYIQKYLMIASKKKMKLYLPYGTWLCSEILLSKWFDIVGEAKFAGNTVITPYNDNQDYIFKVYNSLSFSSYWNLENLSFQSFSKTLNGACIDIERAQYGYLTNISFQNVKGQAISLKSCWEINFTNIIARHIIPLVLGEDKGVFQFDGDSSLGSISTLYFNYIQLESIVGNVFVISEGNGVYNNHIGTINIESSVTSSGNDEMLADLKYSEVLDDTILENHFALFKLLDNTEFAGCSINTIDTNNLASCIYNYNNKNYILDSIFYKEGVMDTNKTLNVQVNFINFVGMKRDVQILNVRNGKSNIVNKNNSLIINNVMYDQTKHKALFNVVSENKIICNSGINPINDNNDFNLLGVNFISEIANGIETTESGNFGFLKYDENSYSPNKLVCYPYTTLSQGGFFRIIGISSFLNLRYKSSNTTSIKVYDEKNNNSILKTIYTTNDEYVWVTINLSTIEGFEIGDIIRVGVTAGYSVSFDCYVLSNTM